jgi:hypothetical protein
MRYVFVEEEMFWSIRKVYDRIAPEWYQPRNLEAELSAGFARFKRFLNDMPGGPLDWETADHAPCRVLYAYLPDREPRFVEAMIAIAGLLDELGPKWVFEAEFEDESQIDLFVCNSLLHFRDTKLARKFAKAVCAPKMQEQAAFERANYPLVSEYDGLVRPNRYERLVKTDLSWIGELGFEPGIMYGTTFKSRPAYDLGFPRRLVDSAGSACVSIYGVELAFNDHGSEGVRMFWMTDHLNPMLKLLGSLGFCSQLLTRPESIYKGGLLSRGLTAHLMRGEALEFCLLGYGYPDDVYDKKSECLRGNSDGIFALEEAQIDQHLNDGPRVLFGEVRMASRRSLLIEADLVKLGFKVIGESRAGLSRWLCDGRIVVELRCDTTTDYVVPVFVAASLHDPARLGAALRAKPMSDPNEKPADELCFDWGFGKAIVRTSAGVEPLKRLG